MSRKSSSKRLMPNMIEEMVAKIPPVTRVFVFSSVILMILCSLEVLTPFSLYLHWKLVLKERQYWRIVTNFLFNGEFGLSFFWNMYLLMFYCSSLEEVAFRNKSADFFYLLFSGALMLLSISFFLGITNNFFSGALMDVVTYIWSRRNPHARMQVLIFPVQAVYLPWTLALISLMMGGSVRDHLLGILCGHIYYFFTDVYPLMPTSGGFRLFKTPKLIKYIFRQHD
jgi:Derlin-2/3